MDQLVQVANLVFAAIVILVTFGFSAYGERKRADVDRALIENGKAEEVLEMRRQKADRSGAFASRWAAQAPLLVALGVASVVSAGVLRAAGMEAAYAAADVWFLIIGIFFLVVG